MAVFFLAILTAYSSNSFNFSWWSFNFSSRIQLFLPREVQLVKVVDELEAEPLLHLGVEGGAHFDRLDVHVHFRRLLPPNVRHAVVQVLLHLVHSREDVTYP